MKIIQHESIPTPGGHYSPIIEHAGTLYVSGQLPVDKETDKAPEGVEAQVTMAMESIEHLLKAAGVDRNHLLQVRIFTVDVNLWPEINEAYAAFMGEHRPARIVVPCGPLHYGCLVEIEATAAAT